MSDDRDIDAKDADAAAAAEYVLGLLPPAERARFAARLIEEPDLRDQLTAWQSRLSALDAHFEDAVPPPTLWPRLERRLFAAAPRRTMWNSAPFWRSFAAVTTAVAIMSVAINLAMPPPADPEAFAARLVAALHDEGSTVSFVALYNPQTHQVRLTATSGSAVPDKDYELWAIEGDKAPISMGVVPIAARTEMVLPPAILAGFGEGTVLAITLEQKGGSPTGAPQGPVVAKGAATAI